MSRAAASLRSLSLTLLAAASMASTCDSTGMGPTGPCPAGLVRVGKGVSVCTPRCALPASSGDYAACSQGYMCSDVTGCYQPCGGSACYPGERCNPTTMRCDRVPDAGQVDAGADAGAPGDVGMSAPDVGMPSDVGMSAPDMGMPSDVGMSTPDVGMPSTDTGASGASCSMRLPTTGTTSVLGSGSGTATLLRLAVNDTHAAWSDGTALTLARLDGTTVGSLPRPGVPHIALSATHLYFAVTGTTSSIYRLPIAGFTTAMPELIRGSTEYIPSFALGPDGIFWAEEDASGATIIRADLDGQRIQVRGDLDYRGRSSERIVDMGVADGVLYVATQQTLGTTGCFRVVRYDAGPTAPTSLAPTVVYGPTAGGCTAATYTNLAFDGATVFFHSSSPAEVVQYAPGSTASRFSSGFGDGTFLGLTPRCLIGSNGGLFGISRTLPIDETRLPLGLPGTPLGRIVVRGAFAYGFLVNRSLYSVFRHGL